MEAEKEERQTRGITVSKATDMSEWYAQVILKSGMADSSAVSGCMIIRPLGYGIWQSTTDWLNRRFKERGVQNAYFPLFIPESFFVREAEHATGFAPEVAWIESDKGDERLAIRPTSETIMYDSFGKWIRSWRDLPLRLNQWCNIVRWEVKDLKMFLRSREFLWQEGHCVYANQEECKQEIEQYLADFKELIEEQFAVPVITGKKTDAEKFAGAMYTLTLESLMPDGKALQLGTVHQLSQGFAKSFNISFKDREGNTALPWQNSWAVSTRLLGALVMTHGDDKGLVIPPRIAMEKGIIIPIYKDESRDEVMQYAQTLQKELGIALDDRESYTPGWKFHEAELKGYPVRIEVGPAEVQQQMLVLVRRDTGEKLTSSLQQAKATFEQLLETMHQDMFSKAKERFEGNVKRVKSWEELVQAIEQKKLGLIAFCCAKECEKEVEEKTEARGISSRCIIESGEPEPCFQCGHPGKLTYFGKSY